MRVAAENNVGRGEWSDTSKGTPSTTPDAPVVGVAPGNEQLTVSWAEPGTGGSAITGYTVQLKDSTVTGWPSASVTEEKLTGTPLATSHTFTGLTNDTAYTVRVKATNTQGDGDWSGDATGTPVSGPSVATVTVSNITQTTANVTVAVANLQNVQHTVHLRYRAQGGTFWPAGQRASLVTTGADVTFSLSHLSFNTDYELQASLDSNFATGIVAKDFKSGPGSAGQSRNFFCYPWQRSVDSEFVPTGQRRRQRRHPLRGAVEGAGPGLRLVPPGHSHVAHLHHHRPDQRGRVLGAGGGGERRRPGRVVVHHTGHPRRPAGAARQRVGRTGRHAADRHLEPGPTTAAATSPHTGCS